MSETGEELLQRYFEKYEVSASTVLSDISAIRDLDAQPWDIYDRMVVRNGSGISLDGDDWRTVTAYVQWIGCCLGGLSNSAMNTATFENLREFLRARMDFPDYERMRSEEGDRYVD